MYFKIFSIVAAIIIIAIVAALAVAYPFMIMWNYAVVKAISVANPIDYWVAFVLMLFITIFIGSSSQNSSK